MDSINRSQPEDNQDNLSGDDAVAKIRELVEKAKTCFFCPPSAMDRPSAGR